MSRHINIGGRAKDAKARMAEEKKNFKELGGGGHEIEGLDAIDAFLEKLTASAGDGEIQAIGDVHSNGNELNANLRVTLRYPKKLQDVRPPLAAPAKASPTSSQPEKIHPPEKKIAGSIGTPAPEPVTATSAARGQSDVAKSPEENKIAGTGQSSSTPIK